MTDKNLLAFSTVACPDWELQRVLDAANEWDYQGIELRTFGAGSAQMASDPALSDPEKVRHAFEQANLQISCLATSVALHYKKKSDAAKALASAKSFIDLAANLGCGRVRVFGYQILPGSPISQSVQRVAGRLLELAEYAEDAAIEVLIENAGSFARSKEVWQLSSTARHPLVGACWNAAYAATVGETPDISVTTLNSMIRYAKLKDTVVGEGSGYVQLGQGTVGIERFVELLRGIGFGGWMCVEWDKIWLPGLAPAEEILPEAASIIREWTRVKVDKKGKVLSKRESPVLEVKEAS